MHYTGTIWRPPYESFSTLIQITAGCTHNACKFCTLYEDVAFKFRMSPLPEIEEDLKELSVHAKSINRIFFTGANPFILNTDILKKLANLVKQYLPKYQSIGCFARITDITSKNVAELKELRSLGYNELTIGVETGDDRALTFMNKGYSSQQIVTECRKLDQAGIDYNFFYLTGISGAGYGELSASKSAEIFNMLRPKKIEVSMLTVFPSSQLYQDILEGNYQESSEIEKLMEQKILVENLNISTIFLANTKSNTAPIEGELPRDKNKIVAHLDKYINTISESDLTLYRKSISQL